MQQCSNHLPVKKSLWLKTACNCWCNIFSIILTKTHHQTDVSSTSSLFQWSPLREENQSFWRFWNIIDEVTAQSVYIIHISSISSNLCQQHLDSWHLAVPSKRIPVVGEAILTIDTFGKVQIVCFSCCFVQPDCSPGQFILKPTWPEKLKMLHTKWSTFKLWSQNPL